jgi:hypothetical protein
MSDMSAVNTHDVTGQPALTSGSSAIVELHVLHNKMIFNADEEDDWLLELVSSIVLLFPLAVALFLFLSCRTLAGVLSSFPKDS